MGINGIVRCPTCNNLVRKATLQDGLCVVCYEVGNLKEKIKHLTHANKTLRKSNKGLKAIVEKLKPYAPKQTFYDTGEAYEL